MNQACKIVTIKDTKLLFKNGSPANNIELIELNEVGYTIVTQIGLYESESRAVFIQPDYSIPDTPFFSEYYHPGGNSSKSKLGSNGRIKAIKFNFNLTRDSMNPVYSYGILIPYDKFESELHKYHKNIDLSTFDIDKFLGITKWTEPEEKNSNQIFLNGDSLPFPSYLYKTDEENVNNIWHTLQYPVKLIGTKKIDGSSITIYCRKNSDNKWTSGICSRTLQKKLTFMKTIGVRKAKWYEYIKMFFKMKVDLRILEEQPSTSEFIKIGKPYLEALEKFCKNSDISIALRGELCGEGLRGSGNKNNPTIREKPHIKFYAMDNIINDTTVKATESRFSTIIKLLDFRRCPVLFHTVFYSKEEIQTKCNNIFNEFKLEQNELIEGIVLKKSDTSWSAKIMNLEYDSKKK
jgi:RNA ligase (TIGR02306 family)